MCINAFRFAWILSLTKNEKLLSLVLTFFGFIFFTFLTSSAWPRTLLVFHRGVPSFAVGPDVCMFLFTAVYLGIACISTLLHLPTATEFDRKRVEISSLQNMSRLVTEVFDFDEPCTHRHTTRH